MKHRFAHLAISIKINFLICFILSNTFTESLAQGKLTEGYIITNQNDTIPGQVRDEGWMESTKVISFKRATESSEQKFSANDIKGFGILPAKEIYTSKKIGILNISLDQIYTTAPSLEAKDSIRVFIQELVSGDKASLYEYIDAAENAHYFVEKNGNLKELFNYPFHKQVDNKKYLLRYDEYKRQLTELTGDADKFKSPIPMYEQKNLKQYIEKYNKSFSGAGNVYKSADNGLTFDLDFNTGMENWNEPPLKVNSKFTYGFGLRMNLPRRYQNRYFKLNLFLTPGTIIPYGPGYDGKITLKTFEFASGSYIGSGKIRPYLGFHYSGVSGNYRQTFLGLQAGISYKRIINLEIGHFANFYTVFSETGFFIRPRISLHYMLSLDKLFR